MLGKHQPVRQAVKWDGHQYVGRCKHCGAAIERVAQGSWREQSPDHAPRYQSVEQLASRRRPYLVRAGGYFRKRSDPTWRSVRAAKLGAIIISIAFAISSAAFATDQRVDQDPLLEEQGPRSEGLVYQAPVCAV